MAQKVTAMDIRMAAAVAGEIDNVAEFCRRRKISRQTFYKFRRRFRDSGIEGLQELSRRPLTSPGQTPVEVEDLIVLRRKQLIEQGRDHGAQSIVWSFERDGVTVPSVSTVWQRGWQILSRACQVFCVSRLFGFLSIVGVTDTARCGLGRPARVVRVLSSSW